ncbi:MAG TPA: hypothetical protein VFN55_05525 [Solirubrobacteraceae bacterium]|nr:hypothetical protein [Solirubrobacteraceae bacterium]
MSAAPAPRRQREDRTWRRPAPEPAGVARRRASAERRRRERHFARRRRDLLQDAAAALIASVLLLCVTAGLGVLALLMLAVSAVLIGSLLGERIIRRRRERAGARPTRRRR